MATVVFLLSAEPPGLRDEQHEPPRGRSGPPSTAPGQGPEHRPNLLNPGPKNLADRFLIFPGHLKFDGAS